MIVLAFKEEEATRIVKGEQTVATYPHRFVATYPHRFYEGSDEKPLIRLDDLVGQTVAVARLPKITPQPLTPSTITSGAIIGSVTVAAVERIGLRGWPDQSYGQAYVDFTPGRWALIFTDPASCEQRCLKCDNDGWTGHYHDGSERLCELHHVPIPYTATGPIGEWTP